MSDDNNVPFPDNENLYEGINAQTMNFGPYVMGVKLPTAFVDELYDRGLGLKNDAREQLAGHLQKEHLYTREDKEWFIKEVGPVFSHYRAGHEQYHGLNTFMTENNPGVTFNVQMKLESLWINFMREGEFNPPHTHSKDLSFVIYLKLPDWQEELDNHVANSPKPGSILFKNELDNYPQEMQWKTQQVKVYPHVGVMWIFPALLTHMVYPYKTPGERVSVSGNITYVNRSEFPKHYF